MIVAVWSIYSGQMMEFLSGFPDSLIINPKTSLALKLKKIKHCFLVEKT